MTIKCNFKAPGQLCGYTTVNSMYSADKICSLPAGECPHQEFDIVKMEGYPNGEITFDPATKEYTAWDETYADTVCITNYPEVAKAALKAYGEHYL